MGLAELVSGWGYRETARDGAEALDKVMAWQPGIIVTDMKMPRIDGIELLNRLAGSRTSSASSCLPHRAPSIAPSKP